MSYRKRICVWLVKVQTLTSLMQTNRRLSGDKEGRIGQEDKPVDRSVRGLSEAMKLSVLMLMRGLL